jgi:hypothetical protein
VQICRTNLLSSIEYVFNYGAGSNFMFFVMLGGLCICLCLNVIFVCIEVILVL